MELTIVLSISPDSGRDNITRTIDSVLNVGDQGIDLVIYSEDTGKIQKIIREEGLEEALLTGDMEILFCQEPFSSVDTYQNIGLEDCKTDYIMFLSPGDTIDFFDPIFLCEKFDVAFGETNGKSIPAEAYESRMLPLGIQGMVFSVDFLKGNDISFDATFLPRVIDILVPELENPDYHDGWGKYSIDEYLSISTDNLTPLTQELVVPQVFTDLWSTKELRYNYYLRDLLWARMTRAAAVIMDSYPGRMSKYLKYLFPENKTEVLE